MRRRCGQSGRLLAFAGALLGLLATVGSAAVSPHTKIVYGDDDHYPPFTFIAARGEPAGFNIDLIRAIGREMAMEVEVRLGPWPEIRRDLEETKRIDVSAMFYSGERDKVVDYAVPHTIVVHELFVRRASPPVDSLQELQGKRVIVQRDAFMAEYLERHWAGIERIYADSEPEALRRLASGEGDAAIAGQAAALHYLDRSGLTNLMASGVPLLPVNYAFVVAQGQSDLLQRLNQGLARVRASGEYADLYGKWFGPQPPGMTWTTAAGYIAAVLVPLLGVTVAVLGWNRSLKRVVKQRTRQLEEELAERQQAERSLREHESRLKQAIESAERANRAKDQFLAVLSHELRTPLTPVLAAVSAELNNGLPGSLRGTFEMIRRNVELEARLIDDLLDLTRLTRGRMTLHLETVDAHAALRQALDVCAAALAQKRHRVQVEMNTRHHHVKADPARLQQIFWNLIQNAAKFSPPGGEVTVRTYLGSDGGEGGNAEVRTRNAEKSDEATKRRSDEGAATAALSPSPGTPGEGRGEGLLPTTLIIEITDTGIGMEPEVLARVFHPFEQAESAISRKYGGLGLGLSISRAIAEAHGGTICAASLGSGKGSVFTVTLPLVVAPAEVVAEALPPARQAGPLRILLVEDSADTLRILARLLKAGGHDVTPADSAAAARRAWGEGMFDLLVSDIGLPDGNGIDLLRELRDGRPIRAIAISGYGAPDDIDRSRAAGFAEHLVKPLDYARLEEAIARVAVAEGAPSSA